jgi:hypothetical protein
MGWLLEVRQPNGVVSFQDALQVLRAFSPGGDTAGALGQHGGGGPGALKMNSPTIFGDAAKLSPRHALPRNPHASVRFP